MPNGRTCIITGASRGIGRAVASQLSQTDGITDFVLIARSGIGLEETKLLMKGDKNIEALALDLQQEAAIINAVANIKDRYGTIDVLINCAGYAEPASLMETDLDNWERTFRINVTSMFLMIREVVRVMKKTGGKIINIASTAGMSSRPGWLAYAASKAAVISLSSTLSSEVEDYGIKVYCLSPGRCATELRLALAPEEDPTTIMQPYEVAQVVSILVGGEGDLLDGQNIVVRKTLKRGL